MRLLTVLSVGAISSVVLLASVVPATAAVELGPAKRNDMVRDVARSEPGRETKLRITQRGRVSFDATSRNIVTADNVLAVRSSISPKWGMLSVAAVGSQGYQRTFLVKRKAGRWTARFGAVRGEENLAICRLRAPSTPVSLDLGFSDAGTYGERCAHKRTRASQVRPMTAAELQSVRRMVEWRWEGAQYVPGPVQPAVTDPLVSDSSCEWDGLGTQVGKARGEVAKADPRWGAVDVGCRVGSAGYTVTQYLVRRSGTSGGFTAVPAHVAASWSSYADLCNRERSWPIPAQPRVALEFCSPFPAVIRSVFR